MGLEAAPPGQYFITKFMRFPWPRPAGFYPGTPPAWHKKSNPQIGPGIRKSITFDNGGEFARHGLIRDAFNMTTCFCDAYASWQKGAVENMNGRLRRDLPRQLDIDKMSDEELQDILLTHNLTPRKCLGLNARSSHLARTRH